jgi:signal transduction histidine kinase/CheY-like chemotaxis protein
LVLSTPLPDRVRQSLCSARFDPAADPFLFRLSGRLALREDDLEGIPFAIHYPDARWALAGVGDSWSFTALLFGTGAPPRGIAGDSLLAEALLRRLGEQAGAGRSRAEAASEALARLSHEFKTPLVTIKGYAELLLDQTEVPLSPKLRDWARRIAAGANRLAAVFRKATAEARTDAAWTYEPQPVDSAQWVRWCVDEAAALASGREIRWGVDAEEGVPTVALEPDAGRDALLELFQNAARATPDGGEVQVLVRTESRGERAGVRVTVRDTGVGVPEGDAAEHLFERFATVTSALEQHSGDFEFGAGGLGLGLSMVRGVARAHGGEAWGEGRGRDPEGLPGASFHLWLPAFAGEAASLPEDAGGERGRVLVVDRDAGACRILDAALSQSYEVVTVGTAKRAQEVWADGAWEACIVEPRIPRGGADLIRALRAHPEGGAAVILAYTTAARGAEASAWRAAGADACVSKPARARSLLQRLRTLRAKKI